MYALNIVKSNLVLATVYSIWLTIYLSIAWTSVLIYDFISRHIFVVRSIGFSSNENDGWNIDNFVYLPVLFQVFKVYTKTFQVFLSVTGIAIHLVLIVSLTALRVKFLELLFAKLSLLWLILELLYISKIFPEWSSLNLVLFCRIT